MPSARLTTAECVLCLRKSLKLTPLEILATTLSAFPNLDAAGRKAFDAYDRFLGMLSDKKTREHLEELPPGTEGRDATWQEARRTTHEFRDALLEIFFDEQSKLYDLTKTYGVF